MLNKENPMKNWIVAGVSALALVSVLAQAEDAKPAAAPATRETAAPAPAPAPAKIKKELTKADALALMSMQYTAAFAEVRLVNAVQRRNDMIEVLRLKYLKEDERNTFLFDVSTLKFYPKADIEKAQKDAADKKEPQLTLPKDIKIIDVSKDDTLAFANMGLAIESAKNDLNQIYTQRNEQVKELLKKYQFTAEDTDIDVVNGNFVEKRKEEPKTGK
jgi:hypothetical protein